MKKLPLFAALAFLMINAAVSCKKEDKPFRDALSNTIWVGATNPGNVSTAFKFGEDAKVTFFFGGVNAPAENQHNGTYTFDNNIVLITIVSSQDPTDKFSFAGTLNNNEINGTLGKDANTQGKGTFTVTKQ